MDNKNNMISKKIGEIWSSTNFENSDILRYAMPRIAKESQRGVATLSIAALIFLLFGCILSATFDFGSKHVYTYALLTALALHIYISTWGKLELSGLYMLAIALLVICGSSLVLIAQQSGKLDAMVFSSVAALFMLVPVVPWGLREALAVVLAIYFMFTSSMVATGTRFSAQDFWLLQFMMLFAAIISVTLVIRALLVRKHDLRAQFHLHQAHNEMQLLLERDPLTGAWNRRFLENRFAEIVALHHHMRKESYFVMFDVDQFKAINDTHGHHEGDRVLQAIVAAFTGVLGENEYIVRMGGDEFALLLYKGDPEARVQAALAIVRRSYGPAQISVGILSIPPWAHLDLDQVYRMADESQYQAKRSGGNQIVKRASAAAPLLGLQAHPQCAP